MDDFVWYSGILTTSRHGQNCSRFLCANFKNMFLIHPRRYIRNFKNWLEIYKLKRQAKKYGVHLSIGHSVRLVGCVIRAEQERKYNNVFLTIGEGCFLKYASFGFWGDDTSITLGEHVHINAGRNGFTSFIATSNSSISIGDDCLFSGSIRFWTTDFHAVLDAEGNRTNPNKDIHIGNHVWIGAQAFIGKGVSIADNSVVGIHSVVTKPFYEENVVIAGNPAMIRKSNVGWNE